jgi:hypothetical protein
MRRLRRHLTYANVAATLALLIAIAGGTSAIAGSNAPKNSVTSSSIKPFNVTARDLAGIRTVQVSGQFNAFASCRSNERLVGGGANGFNASGPIGASSPGNNGWYVEQAAGLEPRPVTATALCLRAKAGK